MTRTERITYFDKLAIECVDGDKDKLMGVALDTARDLERIENLESELNRAQSRYKEAIVKIECRDADIQRLITYSELRDSQLNDANSAIREIDSWIPGLKGEICNHEKSCEAIDRALKES